MEGYEQYISVLDKYAEDSDDSVSFSISSIEKDLSTPKTKKKSSKPHTLSKNEAVNMILQEYDEPVMKETIRIVETLYKSKLRLLLMKRQECINSGSQDKELWETCVIQEIDRLQKRIGVHRILCYFHHVLPQL